MAHLSYPHREGLGISRGMKKRFSPICESGEASVLLMNKALAKMTRFCKFVHPWLSHCTTSPTEKIPVSESEDMPI